MVALVVLCISGCKKVEESFSGLRGYVAYGPLEGATVKVFDGSQFTSQANTNGLLATGTVDSAGQFDIDLPDANIGRTLLVFLEFPADNPLSAADERAVYRSFDAARSAIRMNPADGPWVAVVDFFEGLAAPVCVSPLTTMSYHVMANLADVEAGPGNARWTQPQTQAATLAMGQALGLNADFARVPPVRVQETGQPLPRYTDLEISGSSAAHTYILMQLDRAATTFAAATTSPADDQRAFYAGLMRDAVDGVMDGKAHGVVVPEFTVSGSPFRDGLLTLTPTADLAAYIGSAGIVTTAEADALRALVSALAMVPEPTEILQAQAECTGAIRGLLIDNIDTQIVPSNGQLQLTIRGRGFQRAPTIVFSPVSEFPIGPGSVVLVNGTSTGEGGNISTVAFDRIVMTSPRFDLTTTPLPLRRTAAIPAQSMDILLRVDRNGSLPLGEVDVPIARVTQAIVDSIVVADARMVRLRDAVATSPSDPVTALLALQAPGTDPASLDPSTTPVCAIELRLINGTTVALSDIDLTAATTLATLGGTPLTFGRFGEAGSPLLTLNSNGDQRAASVTIAPGGSEWQRFPFVIDATQIGAGVGQLAEGTVLRVAPSLRAIGTPGGSEVLTSIATHIPAIRAQGAPATNALNPMVSIESVSAPATIVALAPSDFAISLLAQGQGAGPFRQIDISHIEIVGDIAVTGGAPFAYAFSTIPQVPQAAMGAVGIASLTITDANNSPNTLPFPVIAAPTPSAGRLIATARLTAQAVAIGQSLDISIRVHWIDRASATTGTITQAFSVPVTAP